MACCAVKLSERGRRRLGSMLLLLNMALAMMGLTVFGVGAVLRFLFQQQKDLIKEYNFMYITNIVMGVGSSMTLFHIVGAKVCYDCSSYKTRYMFKAILLIQIALSFVAEGAMLTMSITCQKTIRSATKGFVTGFLELMNRYSADETKRLEIDLLQIKHQCCGATNHTDWLTMEWYDNIFLRPEVLKLKQLMDKLSPYQKQKLSQRKGMKQVSPRGVPFTCCDPRKMGPCIHDIILYQKPGFKLDKEGSRFYQIGCGDALMVNIKWLLNALSLWILLPFWIELLSVICIKYLYSSICTASDIGDGKGSGYGYLMEKSPIALCNCFECDITQLAEDMEKSEEDDEWMAASKHAREVQLQKFRQEKRKKKNEKREQGLMTNARKKKKGNIKTKTGKKKGTKKQNKNK